MHFSRRGLLLLIAAAMPAVVMLVPTSGHAQATAVKASGLGTKVNGSEVTTCVGATCNITGGTQRGNNVFHSFDLFDVINVGATIHSANFCNSAACGAAVPLVGIQNILGRVTGGQVSNISGRIQTTGFGTASLYLLNPAGWIFGPNASLSVGGSFHVSTANYVLFPDQVRFVADTSALPDNGLNVNPLAFGFLTANPAGITVDGGTLQIPTSTAATGTLTLNLVGGNMTIKGVAAGSATRTLRAASGRVQVVSVASTGEVTLNPDVSSFSSLGQINMERGAFVDVNGTTGSVVILAGRLIMKESARIQANTTGAVNPSPVVDIRTSDLIELSGGSSITSNNTGANPGGAVMLEAPTVTLDGASTQLATSGFGNGAGGHLIVDADTFRMSGSATMTAFTRNKGGDVRVTATDLVEISGNQTGISAGSSAGANALTDVGDIIVTSRRVSVINGGQITNGSIIGQTGNLTITGTESINVENGGGISSQAFGSPVGTATFSTPNLLINNGFISTSTIGTGNAGPILIDGGATGIVNITNGGQIASNSALAATGSGGNVTLNTGTVTISGTSPTGNPASPLNTNPNSGIYSTAAGTGNAGQINITSSTLNMDSAGTISVATSGAGNAGSVALNVTNFTQTSGARVDSSTSSGGQGGDIVITAANTATISGADTGLFSTASGTGPGGDITLTAGQMVDLNNNGTLSAQSTGTATATAGNITITTPLFQSQNGIVTTGATLADGGNISINTTGSLVYLTDSQITTSVQSGVGGGGNIAIDSELVALDHSGVNADAFGGPGGNINILADVFLSSHSSVTASSALSTSGTIDIQATFTDVSGSLAQLPETPLRATELLRAACAARFAGGKASSLVLAGRDAVPYQPGSLLPSPLYLTGPSAETRTTSQDTKLQFTLLESENRYSSRFSLLPNAHCSL